MNSRIKTLRYFFVFSLHWEKTQRCVMGSLSSIIKLKKEFGGGGEVKVKLENKRRGKVYLSEKRFWVKGSDRGLFVTASHQTGLDTRSKARRPIKVGIRGREDRERVETRTLLVYAAHRLTWCNVNLMRQAVSRTQMWVQARMPGYGLN